MTKYAGADWLQGYRDLSPLGVDVADILGQAWAGIYHLDKEVLHKRCDWKSDRWIEVVINGPLSTWDNSRLTALLVLCHSKKIRLQLAGAALGYLRLAFGRDAQSFLGPMPPIFEHIEHLRGLVAAIHDMDGEGGDSAA